jgi:hypothetical protein
MMNSSRNSLTTVDSRGKMHANYGVHLQVVPLVWLCASSSWICAVASGAFVRSDAVRRFFAKNRLTATLRTKKRLTALMEVSPPLCRLPLRPPLLPIPSLRLCSSLCGFGACRGPGQTGPAAGGPRGKPWRIPGQRRRFRRGLSENRSGHRCLVVPHGARRPRGRPTTGPGIDGVF